MSKRTFPVFLSLLLLAGILCSQDARHRLHPQVDYRLEAAALKGDGALVVLYPWDAFRPADVAADLGLTADVLQTGTYADIVDLSIPGKEGACEFVTGNTLEERIDAFADRVLDVLRSS